MYQFMSFADQSSHECDILTSPLDVQLDCDERTMVQPDIVILCNQKKNTDRCVYGAPDFVLEVLSPSTRRKDLILKLNKYLNAGCREYWIVDPADYTITVYDFEHQRYPLHYTFDDEIPVNISGGECKICLKGIKQRVADSKKNGEISK